MVQDGCCVACGSLLMEKLCSTYSLFVLWWGVNSGCESLLVWVALGSYQASQHFLGIVPLFLHFLMVTCTKYYNLSQHVHSPWNQGINWSELGSNPARREISLDLNHSITASLLGGLAVWNSRWAEGLRLLLLAGLRIEKPTLLWPLQRTVKTSSQGAMTHHSKNTECKKWLFN